LTSGSWINGTKSARILPHTFEPGRFTDNRLAALDRLPVFRYRPERFGRSNRSRTTTQDKLAR